MVVYVSVCLLYVFKCVLWRQTRERGSDATSQTVNVTLFSFILVIQLIFKLNGNIFNMEVPTVHLCTHPHIGLHVSVSQVNNREKVTLVVLSEKVYVLK